MSPEAVFSINNGFLLLICGLFSLIVPFGSTQQRNSKSEEFSCPEDFGYYPHPSDCTQYFVCVFGDPLLESCTGGLMYSHDLRTCDWPRNVGCGVTAAASSKNENVGLSSGNVNSAGRQHTTTSWRQEIPEPQHDEIPDKNLYEEEDLGPAEEVETDRQQRVYRGQPPTLGQVARDRDGIIRHANALQTSSGIEKVKPIGVVSFGSHHQSLSKGNSTNSLRFEPYTEDLDDLTKLETNRIKRDLTARGENKEIQMLNETTRSNGGYALRYRPLTDDVNSNDNHLNSSYEPNQIPTATSIQTLPHKISNHHTPILIKLSSSGLRPSHNIVSQHRILTTTTQRTVHANPLSASSSLFNRYSDSSNSFSNPGHRYAYPIDDSPVATDFTIVNVVPKSQQASSSISSLRPTTIPVLQQHNYLQPQPSIMHHYAELNPFPHMPKPPPPGTAYHNFPVRHLGHYPHPYYYSQNYMNNYASPLVTPQFYPTPNNRFVHYNEPEPSIVTLSYPKPEQNPIEQMRLTSTVAPTDDTAKNSTTTITQDGTVIDTGQGEGKPSNGSETKIQETKTKHKPNDIDSSEVDDDPDFNSNDETGDDEVEETDQEDEEFEKIYFEDDNDDTSENNKTNHSIPEIKFSAKKQTTTTNKPNEILDNDELDGGYSFNDKEVSVTTDEDKDKSEEEQSPADEQVEYEEVQEEEDDDNDTEEEEKDDGTELVSQSTDEGLDEIDADDETVKKGQDHLIKPAISYYNRYFTDHQENPLTNPNFDFQSYLSDLTKPNKSKKERMKRLRQKAAQIANRMDKTDSVDSSFKHIQKRSINVQTSDQPTAASLQEANDKEDKRTVLKHEALNSSENLIDTNKINQWNMMTKFIPPDSIIPFKEESEKIKENFNSSNFQNIQVEESKILKHVTSKLPSKLRENSHDIILLDTIVYDQYFKNCYTNFSSPNVTISNQSQLPKPNAQSIKLNILSAQTYANPTRQLHKLCQPKQDYKNRRRRQHSRNKNNKAVTDQTLKINSPEKSNAPIIQEVSVTDIPITAQNQKLETYAETNISDWYSNLEIFPQNYNKTLQNLGKNNSIDLTKSVLLLSDKYDSNQNNSSPNLAYHLYLVELPENLNYSFSNDHKNTEKTVTDADQKINIDTPYDNKLNQSRNRPMNSEKDQTEHILDTSNKILIMKNDLDLPNILKIQSKSNQSILLKLDKITKKDLQQGESGSNYKILPRDINEVFKEININEEITKKAQDHLIAPAMSQYNQYISDQYENSFTNPNFDYRSYPLYPITFKSHRLNSSSRGISQTYSRKQPLIYQQTRNFPKPNVTYTEPIAQYASQKEDRIMHLKLTNNSISKSPSNKHGIPGLKMQHSSARLVPLALLHTYKPANHSYLHKRLRIPTTKNFYDSSIDFGTTYFDPNKFNSFSKSDDYEPFQPPSSLSSIVNDREDTNGDEEENEEDTIQNSDKNDGKESGDEYYDDYAEEYTDDEHIEQPLSKPEIPSIPSRLKNIDDEVFGEKQHIKEEKQQTDDEEIPQDDTEEEEQEDSDNENEEAVKNGEEENKQAEDDNDEDDTGQQKQDDTDEEEEYEEDDDREPEKYQSGNSDDEEEEEPEISHNTNAETISSSKKVKKPQLFHPPTSHHIDQVMTPHHRQNKYLQNPLPSLSTYLLPPKPFTQNPTVKASTLRFKSSTVYPPQPNLTPIFSTTPTSLSQRRPIGENDKKLNPATKSSTLKIQMRPQQINGDKRFHPVNSTHPLIFPSNFLPNGASITNSQSQNSFVYDTPARNPPYRVEQRNKTITTMSKGKSINEDLNKNYAYYNVPNVNGISVQMASKSKRPLPSVPSYIVEDSQSSVPTTSKSIYNVTKIDPFYSVYDENQEIYRNSEIDQFHKQRKQPTDFQILQNSHRLQPHSSSSLNNPTIYTNQDYRHQSEIDDESQQSDKLISSKLFVDSNTGASARPPIDKSLFTNPFIPKITNINPPVVELQPPYTDTTRSTLSNNPPNRYVYDSVQSQELEYRTEDAHIGETSYSPKVTPYIRKFSSTQPTPTTPKQIRGISYSKGSFILSTDNFPSRDHFRIIVEPVAKNSSTLPKITKPTTSSLPTTVEFKVATNKLQLGDKFSNTFRSSNAPSSQTLTHPSLSTVATSTTSTTLAKATNSLASENDAKLNNRRFYIPKTNPVERKLHFNYETTTNANNLGLGLQRTDSHSIKQELQPPKLLDARADHLRVPHSKLTPPSPPTTSSSSSTQKQPPDNEVLYYDDDLAEEIDDYEDVETSQNVDSNYIDNKIVDYTSTSQQQPQPVNQTPKITTTHTYGGHTPSHPSTNVHGPSKSFSSPAATSTRNPYEFVKTRLKDAEISTKRTVDKLKAVTTADRCPQCNEKPFVRGRGRGSVTYSPGGNEFVDGVTASSGRSRPTLKPSTSIVSKSEAVDIYKYAPRRPDNVYPTPQPDKVAAKCRKDICLLPDCSCGGKDIPGDLSPEETPQMVLLTFDDSVNELNRGLYVDLFEKGRVNPNGCPISATFYVSHEWTDYSMVQNLYAAGHEIASHSVSHSFGEQFSQRKWTKEIVGQREILSAYGGVRQEDIRGMRAPFLAVGGNKMFKMLYDANFTYDSSMPIYENRPPSWPYTMDYKLFHDCMIPPCPTRSYPGVWEIPMVMWQDLNGGRCSMGDACSNPPTADGVYKMLIKNFERHFSTNRAPFGLFYHSSWFTQPHHKEGFMAFLDTIVNMPEVWLVTNWQVIQWVRDPTPISRLNKFSPFNCDYPERPRRCNNAKVCNLWHKSGVRYLKTCQACPDVYPWTGKTGVRNSRIDIEEPPSTE